MKKLRAWLLALAGFSGIAAGGSLWWKADAQGEIKDNKPAAIRTVEDYRKMNFTEKEARMRYDIEAKAEEKKSRWLRENNEKYQKRVTLAFEFMKYGGAAGVVFLLGGAVAGKMKPRRKQPKVNFKKRVVERGGK